MILLESDDWSSSTMAIGARLEASTCEALVRWTDPAKGPVSPAELMPIAEETGLIGPLGESILRQACTEAAKWPPHVSVAVNLSPLQFRDRQLAATVADILGETGLNPSRLQLEITESVLLNKSEGNLLVPRQIRQLAAKIAMDDLGTGYSSLRYLRTFPYDKIEIDRSFVSDLPTGKESLAIIRAVAAIGRALGITTTVEGVDTQAQFDLIRAEGFDEVQAYLVARPLPAKQVLGSSNEGQGRRKWRPMNRSIMRKAASAPPLNQPRK